MGLPLETALPGIGTGAGKQSLPCVPSGGRRPASGASLWSRLFMTWGQISSENTCDYI